MTYMGKQVQEVSRLPGRPRQSESEVGREKLIEDARKVISIRPRTDIQRREIADVVGVTPALINYYFSNKWDLLEAASYPSINGLFIAIDSVISSHNSMELKFDKLIDVYLSFHANNSYALDYYIASSRNLGKKENIEAVRYYRNKVCGFIREHYLEEASDARSAEIVHSTLWSVCECLGRLSVRHRSGPPAEGEHHSDMRAYKCFVLRLFLEGVILQKPS